jgi:hypothetical protein
VYLSVKLAGREEYVLNSDLIIPVIGLVSIAFLAAFLSKRTVKNIQAPERYHRPRRFEEREAYRKERETRKKNQFLP